MPPKKDLTGQCFGHLIVLKQVEKIGKDTHTAWETSEKVTLSGNRILYIGANSRLKNNILCVNLESFSFSELFLALLL